MSFLILVDVRKLYLVNLCPIFVGSFQNLSKSWEGNNYLRLISSQNLTSGRMGNFFLQSKPDSNISDTRHISGDKAHYTI